MRRHDIVFFMKRVSISVFRGLKPVLFFAAPLLLAIFISAGDASAQTTEKYFAPQLNVPIPGLDFTQYPIVKSGGKLSIPFFAAYVSVAYRYLLSITVIAAAVAFTYGAFLYLIGSAVTSIQTGKKIMADAVIGMLLILASHLILRTLNSDLVTPKDITVTSLKTIEWIDDASTGMANADLATGSPPEQSQPPAATLSAPVPSSAPPAGAGQCPIQQAGKEGMPRSVFFAGITPLLTGGTAAERAVQAADLAAKCNLEKSFCGSIAGAMWVAGGVGDKSACSSKASSCTTQENAKLSQPVRFLNPSVGSKLRDLTCGANIDCFCNKKKTAAEKLTCKKETATPPNPSCMKTKREAMAAAKTAIQGAESGWPDSWANELKPGDIFWIYNGNDSCGGTHAGLFLGWEGEKARTFEGDTKNSGRYRTRCFKTSCGAADLLTAIFRPR